VAGYRGSFENFQRMAFAKILIANRGEIACRIIRTAHALGYRTVAVFSDADRSAPHVALAHEAVRIGPAPAQESYLDIEALLAAAKRSGADAVHPGYGFVAENAAFAQACADAGLVFIGPQPAAVRTMGNKAGAKRLMAEAGIACVPGYHGADQSDQRFTKEAGAIGFPVMVKAAAGGGGRGMRLVNSAPELAAALAAARSEATRAFGSGELLIEKAITDPRHIEIQIIADHHGNVVHLGERDCSIQRRHQKVIEEAPSSALDPQLRAEMGRAAVLAARRIDYRGAGTVEFLLDGSGRFYFLEMNTRLQVEHAVTEAITGLDLVALQLQVAAGELLSLAQDDVRPIGHAIEARLYAEDASRDFLPSTGTIAAWQPPAGPGVRVDHALSTGQEITAFYDPLLAKLVGYGRNREEARRRLVAALEDTVLLGITTNRGFLEWALEHPVFIAGRAKTAFIGRHFRAELLAAVPDETAAVAALLLFEARTTERPLAYWSSTDTAASPLRLIGGGHEFATEITPCGGNRFAVALGDRHIEFEILNRSVNELRLSIDGLQQTVHFSLDGERVHVTLSGNDAVFCERLPERRSRGESSVRSELRAPMSGAVIKVLRSPGDLVRRGERVLVIEAMKMQHEITAQIDGVLACLHVGPGDQVAARQLLAEIRDQELEAGDQMSTTAT
jgi:geranyl-CoA carboxylase alpha subunit